MGVDLVGSWCIGSWSRGRTPLTSLPLANSWDTKSRGARPNPGWIWPRETMRYVKITSPTQCPRFSHLRVSFVCLVSKSYITVESSPSGHTPRNEMEVWPAWPLWRYISGQLPVDDDESTTKNPEYDLRKCCSAIAVASSNHDYAGRRIHRLPSTNWFPPATWLGTNSLIKDW